MFFDRARAKLAKHDYDGAIADFDQVIARARPSVEAYAGRGDAWLRKRDYDKAIADYGLALNIDPKRPLVLIARARAYVLKGSADPALRDLDEALRLEPKNRATEELRAIAFDLKGDWDGQIAQLNRLIGEYPNDATVWTERCWQRAGHGRDLDAAIHDCDTAEKLETRPAADLRRARSGVVATEAVRRGDRGL